MSSSCNDRIPDTPIPGWWVSLGPCRRWERRLAGWLGSLSSASGATPWAGTSWPRACAIIIIGSLLLDGAALPFPPFPLLLFLTTSTHPSIVRVSVVRQQTTGLPGAGAGLVKGGWGRPTQAIAMSHPNGDLSQNDTQTHRHTDTQTHRHTDTHTHTHTHRQTDTHTQLPTPASKCVTYLLQELAPLESQSCQLLSTHFLRLIHDHGEREDVCTFVVPHQTHGWGEQRQTRKDHNLCGFPFLKGGKCGRLCLSAPASMKKELAIHKTFCSRTCWLGGMHYRLRAGSLQAQSLRLSLAIH